MLHKDFKEFIELLNAHKVEYLIVGAHAVAFHARPRFTGDLDVFVRPSQANASRLVAVLRDFGFGQSGLTASDFLGPNHVVQLGYEPVRIDIVTSISGVSFDDAWIEKCPAFLDGIPVNFPSKRHLIVNKQSIARDKDIVDLENLRNVKEKP